MIRTIYFVNADTPEHPEARHKEAQASYGQREIKDGDERSVRDGLG